MLNLQFVIDELRKAEGPSRRLDAFIAEAIGWKRRSAEYHDSKTGTTRTRVLWIVPSGTDYGQVPPYTADIDEAYDLTQKLLPKHVAAIGWDDLRGRAVIDNGWQVEAATPAIALCLAALITKNAS